MTDITEAAVAVSGTRRSMKELVDGTLRVQIDIEPRHKGDFYRLFANIDMPVALAPLNVGQNVPHGTDHKTSPKSTTSGQLLSLYAALLCQSGNFHRYIVHMAGYTGLTPGEPNAEAAAADWMRQVCEIESRRELDSDPEAATRFHERVRKPYNEWLSRQKGV